MSATRTAAPTVPCAVCGRPYRAIDNRHLKAHGLTLDTYQRTYPNAPLTPDTDPTQAPSPLATTASLAVAEALVTDPVFVTRMADSVAQTIFGSSLRDQLRLALCSTLSARMEIHGRAVAHLQSIRTELAQPWRLTAAGKDGAPTPNGQLISMAGQAHHEVAKTEDALLRAIRLAAEEQRDTTIATNLHGRPAFTGEAEVIPVPPSLSPGERETVRSLLGLLREEMAERAATRALPPPSTPTDPSLLGTFDVGHIAPSPALQTEHTAQRHLLQDGPVVRSPRRATPPSAASPTTAGLAADAPPPPAPPHNTVPPPAGTPAFPPEPF